MHMDVFNNDAFSVTGLTATIQDTPYVPGRLGQLGLFEERGIPTTSVSIEKRGNTVQLVPAGERGQSGKVYKSRKRSMLKFETLHLPQRATILADEIQNMRAFGTESEVQTMQRWVDSEYLTPMKRDIEVTHEHLRIGAIKGSIVDSDGVTELLDLFAAFGLSQQSLSFDLDESTTSIRQKIVTLKRAVRAQLGNIPFTGIRVLCASDFFDDLVEHEDAKEAYERWNNGGYLRADVSDTGTQGFEWGSTGVFFEEYYGGVGNNDFIESNTAYAIPMGVPGLFISRYAPGDYMTTVNTPGLPYYASQERLPHDKGIDLEAQSNPLHMCTRPTSVIKVTHNDS